MIFEYPVLGVREVHDGDTFRLDLDVGFEHSAWPWLRLKDYSCPELRQSNGPEAKAFTLAELVIGARDQNLWVHTFKRPGYEDMSKSFARYLAAVYFGPVGDLGRSEPLGERLVAAGLARRGAFEG